MLYHLFDFLEKTYQPAGFQVIYFITVRAGLAAATAMLLALVLGKRLIGWLENHQFRERVRKGENAGAVSHAHKAGTPTMGGIIIIMAILGSTLLWANLTNIYVWLAVLATAWMGGFGFADDYIKVIKKDKGGLRKRSKVIGQVSLGLLLGIALYFYPPLDTARSLTNLPFLKDGTFDYDLLSGWAGMDLGWLIYIPIVVFIITALSNATNLTDGLDGLAAGIAAFVALGLAVLCYVAGNAILTDYLNILYLPGSGEMTIFAAAMGAACLGFLWYNGHPAQVFMGDTGSMALGAAIGTVALMIKIELLLPILCGAFFVETLSVIIQTSYFKYTRYKTGTGERIFLMAPLHHHYEAQGVHESKIVIRFWILTAILVILTLLTFRIR